MDVTEQIGAAEREVAVGQRDGREVKIARARRTYAADVGDVWDALTSAERIPRWFLPVSGELRPGGRFQFEGNAGGVVERCDAPTLVAVTWEYGDEVSWLVVRLSPVAAGTVLELEHTAPVDPERWAEYGPGAVGVGWDMALYALREHLSSGQPVDPAAAQAWMSSSAGIDFITRASEDWARASIEAGGDAAIARAAAKRTTAFYTGAPESS